ncbi:hypothetical protein RE6C_05363 [Rhodopirellula europaea 6C]|uniref:Uncharacterized protein n=1 Tax=Rhodopirellula europaea 6C TaxID=1263867 RepID=M2AB83_9BACT|nr:hypothetical protein RE6C_05363 [Rhodopirellula europaea 6C]
MLSRLAIQSCQRLLTTVPHSKNVNAFGIIARGKQDEHSIHP